jgi:lactoylglutathione lyase
MVTVTGLFEVHLTVSNLERSMAFYRDVVGLQLARVFEDRRVAFFWIGPGREAMVGLWATGDGPQRLSLHTAFRTVLEQVLVAPNLLRAAGVEPLDFDGAPTHEPIVLGWMPAAAVYFRDPDGHLLEYLTVLPGPARPEVGVVPWREWQRMQGA